MALTPMMQQYLQIKEQCKDAILFFRLGDFYEMFFEDAEIASKELELVLTGKDCGLDERAPMCGVPFHAAENYIPKLIQRGYKVAICEQVEDASQAKGLVRREIVRIVTPGTILENNMLDEKQNNYLACLYFEENLYSLSLCDISTGEFLVTSDNVSPMRSVDELSKYNPAEIIIVDNNIEIKENLIKMLKARYDILINIKTYDPQENQSLIDKFPDDVKALNKFELISSGSLFKYIIETQRGVLSHITSIKRYETRDYMVLDNFTRKNLELTETIRSKNRKGSLLWVLDKTDTAMGGRLLRKWLEEPLIKKEAIELRNKAVEELIDNIYVASDLKEFLKGIYDIERIISRISCKSANARELVSLKDSLRNLPDIKSTLSQCNSFLLNHIYNDFDTLDDLFKLIDESISDNPPIQIKEGGLIKKGYNNQVDELHDAMINGKKWIAELEQSEKDSTGIKSLKIGYNKIFGYYIEITNANKQSIPEGRYIRKQTLANSERFITPELKEMEDKILGSEEKVIQLEYDLFTHIRDMVAKEVLRVQKTAHYLAMVDVLLSFAKVSAENNYVMPTMTEDGVIDIRDGRHPVIEKVISGIFVPNDTYLDNKDNTVLVITGPNMAGKSTFMRQVALITLMAHIGCFIPASQGRITVTDRIFTRIGASDDLSLGQSTFMVEMTEVANILNNATSDSLILFDEVGRGTSTYDGLSIAWAVVDFTVNKIKAKTLFATHYHELTELEGKLKGVQNYCISVKEHGDDIIFLRKIIKGGADQSYGIQVAKLAGLPNAVINKSRKILHQLEERDINKNENKVVPSILDEVSVTETKDNLQLSMFNFKENEVINMLREIDILNTTPLMALKYLHELTEKVRRN